MGPTSPELELPDGPLVTGDWLQDHLDHARVRVLDARGRHPSSSLPHAKRREHAAGHIPGATFVDWEHDFIDTSDPVPVQVAGPTEFAERAGELGVGDGDLVVTYDDYYGIFAVQGGVGVSLLRSTVESPRRRLEHLDGRGPAGERPERDARAACVHGETETTVAARARRCGSGEKCGRDLRGRATATPVRRRAGSCGHRPHPGIAVPALPGARRWRDRIVGGAVSGQTPCARCRDRPGPTAARPDRDLRKRGLSHRRAVRPGAHRRSRRGRVRRVLQRVERGRLAPGRVRPRRLTTAADARDTTNDSLREWRDARCRD